MCRVSRFYAMPISSGRWLRTLQCITTVLLFRFAHSFCWKASLVRVDVSCYAQPTSCFNYNLLMSRRGDRPPSPPAPAVRGQPRRRTSLWAEEAQQDEVDAASEVNDFSVDDGADTLGAKRRSAVGYRSIVIVSHILRIRCQPDNPAL